ncbi:Bacterial regulatory protein, gntR family [Neomoorella glycerini]|uniref:Bacterial regulatory protein, gntR family n=1 Tax=Neomoorella glycerini TaxID=55779 RepID=A0A6I5ZLY6_9FIRM|nr:GntR family transcriptional regulator [Moorella glycerini]QGP90858.1 Bacterial regulatory protein, gntR family [Moorella glycerini]
MAIAIDWDSGIPLWLQVKQGLLRQILAGVYKPGDQLPTVRQLAVELSINYNTVNRAYMELEREGFIVSRKGKGTFVAELGTVNKQTELNIVEEIIDAFLEKIIAAGVSPDAIIDLLQKRLKKIKTKI